MIYLDNAATTKPDKTALSRAEKFLNEDFFNPSSLYGVGLNCAKEIKVAKEHILKSIGAIETISALTAIKAGDVAVKASNVKLIETRIAKGY